MAPIFFLQKVSKKTEYVHFCKKNKNKIYIFLPEKIRKIWGKKQNSGEHRQSSIPHYYKLCKQWLLCVRTLDLPPPSAPVPAYMRDTWSPFRVHICRYTSMKRDTIWGLPARPRDSSIRGISWNTTMFTIWHHLGLAGQAEGLQHPGDQLKHNNVYYMTPSGACRPSSGTPASGGSTETQQCLLGE